MGSRPFRRGVGSPAVLLRPRGGNGNDCVTVFWCETGGVASSGTVPARVGIEGRGAHGNSQSDDDVGARTDRGAV